MLNITNIGACLQALEVQQGLPAPTDGDGGQSNTLLFFSSFEVLLMFLSDCLPSFIHMVQSLQEPLASLSHKFLFVSPRQNRN